MKLTSREKLLVSVLFVGIFIFVMFNYFISPTIKDIETLKVTKQEKELEMATMEGIINRKQEYIDAYELYHKEIVQISEDHYVDLKQEDMLVLLNNLNNNENLQIDNFSFSYDSNDANTLDQLIVKFDYIGPYQEVYNFLDNIGRNDEYIQVSNLDIKSIGDNEISGEIVTNFNSIPMVSAFTEGDSIFDIYGSLAQKQFDSPFVRYPSLAEKYAQEEVDNDTLLSNYLETRSIDPVNNFIRKEMFFVGSDRSVTADIMTHPDSLLGNNSILFDYDFGFKKNGLEANLVFEDEIIISETHEYLSVVTKANATTNHELGITLVDSYGKSHLLTLTDAISSDEWEIYEVDLPLEIIYPARVQRIYVRSTSNEQQLFGKLNIDGVLLADTKEKAEEE